MDELKNEVMSVFITRNNTLNKRIIQLLLLNKRPDLLDLYNRMVGLYGGEITDPSQLVYMIVHNIRFVPICSNDNCNNECQYQRWALGFKKYCSNGCSTSDHKRTEKIKQTKVERYGIGYVDVILNETKQTNLEKYGCEYPLQNEDIRNKANKGQGYSIGFQREEVREKAQQTLIAKYGKKSGNAVSHNETSIEKIKNVEYFKLEYIHNKKSFNTLSKELGISRGVVITHFDTCGLERQHNYISNPQQTLIKMFDEMQQKYKLNDRTILCPKELDFYIPEYNIAIEMNGLWWHSDNYGWPKNGHIYKTLECNKKGIHLLHFWEFEINNKLPIVKSIINNFLGNNITIFARKCVVREVDAKICNAFIKDNHIQGNIGSSIKLGLYQNDVLVAVMTFGKPRYNKQFEYELIRYCTIIGHNVVGGASKLFSYFKKKYNPINVISYSDKRLFSGKMYTNIGFSFSHTSAPNYHYFKEGQYDLLSRVQFQKHKLKNVLPIYKEELSEWENMKINKYNRVWDCGTDVWIWFR